MGQKQKVEDIIIETQTNNANINMVNFYNPCKRLTVDMMDEITSQLNGKIICCGDFSAHRTLWDKYNDQNGIVI